jgi:hypothetical protein
MQHFFTKVAGSKMVHGSLRVAPAQHTHGVIPRPIPGTVDVAHSRILLRR